MEELGKEEKKELAKKYIPILRLHEEEKFTPTDFSKFKCRNPKKKWFKLCKVGIKKPFCLYKPTVYIHFLEGNRFFFKWETSYETKDPLVIQYWYYFAFNEYYTVLNHSHDWEMIQVVLNQNKQLEGFCVTGHGWVTDVTDPELINIYQTEGFSCNKGAHNFASFFKGLSNGKITKRLNKHNEDKEIKIIPKDHIKRTSSNENVIGINLTYKKNILKSLEMELKFLDWNVDRSKYTSRKIPPPWKKNKYKRQFWETDSFYKARRITWREINPSKYEEKKYEKLNQYYKKFFENID